MVESKHSWKAWLYLAPAIILLLVFTVWPIANSVVMAFNEGYDAMTAAAPGGFKFNFGFGNFTKAFDKGSNFIIRGVDDIPKKGLGALGNTMLLTIITVPISTLLALLIAVALNSIKRLQRFYQTIFFLPYVTNSIAIGLVFQAMFNVTFSAAGQTDSIGVFNFIIQPLLQLFGVEYVDWIGVTSSYWSKIFVTSMYIIWNALPFKILILMGGLQSISKQYYDAAKIDGTSRFRVFTKITVPLLSPMLSYVIITSFISGFKEYSSVVALFENDSMVESGQLSTMVGYIYQFIGGDNSKYGAAAAAALILFAIIFVVTQINLYVSKKNTHY